jgi:hypothetical protein
VTVPEQVFNEVQESIDFFYLSASGLTESCSPSMTVTAAEMMVLSFSLVTAVVQFYMSVEKVISRNGEARPRAFNLMPSVMILLTATTTVWRTQSSAIDVTPVMPVAILIMLNLGSEAKRTKGQMAFDASRKLITYLAIGTYLSIKNLSSIDPDQFRLAAEQPVSWYHLALPYGNYRYFLLSAPLTANYGVVENAGNVPMSAAWLIFRLAVSGATYLLGSSWASAPGGWGFLDHIIKSRTEILSVVFVVVCVDHVLAWADNVCWSLGDKTVYTVGTKNGFAKQESGDIREPPAVELEVDVPADP